MRTNLTLGIWIAAAATSCVTSPSFPQGDATSASGVQPVDDSGLIVDVDVDALDPTASYSVSWTALGDPDEVQVAVDEIDDIRAFFDLQQEGRLVIEDMVQIDPDARVIVMGDEMSLRTVGLSCAAYANTRSYNKSGVVAPFNETLDIGPNLKSTVNYSPSCATYPCTRTMKGTNVTSTTTTDHHWRSGAGAWVYFGSSNTTPFWWNRSYYSGTSAINYKAESCTCYINPLFGNPWPCNAAVLSVQFL